MVAVLIGKTIGMVAVAVAGAVLVGSTIAGDAVAVAVSVGLQYWQGRLPVY